MDTAAIASNVVGDAGSNEVPVGLEGLQQAVEDEIDCSQPTSSVSRMDSPVVMPIQATGDIKHVSWSVMCFVFRSIMVECGGG